MTDGPLFDDSDPIDIPPIDDEPRALAPAPFTTLDTFTRREIDDLKTKLIPKADGPAPVIPIRSGFAAEHAAPPAVDDKTPVPEPTDFFDDVIRQLFADASPVTAPGTIDPRWATLIAQAYRDALARAAGQASGGLLLRLESGGLAMYQIDAVDHRVDVPDNSRD